MIERVYSVLNERIEDVRLNEPMAAHTSFKVGGCADIMTLPKTVDGVRHVIQTARAHACPLLVTGRGTNLLVTSKGLRGIVLKLADNFSGIEFDGESVHVKSGTLLSVMVREGIAHGFGGAECLGGIPGTVGGAVCMNAGAYDGEIKDFVEEVYLCSWAADITLSNAEMGFCYRGSILSGLPLVVTGVRLRLKPCCEEASHQKLCTYNERRREKQPLEYPSAGSTFKRPKGGFAGTLIEQTGLKGLCIGGAQVSDKHAGFVINKGNATPEDIITLIKTVQERVKKATGIELEPEVKIVGER